jgi:low temperature requirement protein LtrA
MMQSQRKHGNAQGRQRALVPLNTSMSEQAFVMRRHATWLELFFDLVFVLAVAQLGRLLSANPTAGGFLLFALLFVPVWWVWTGFSCYGDLFDPGDGPGGLPYRLVMFLAMLDSLVLAVTLHSADTASGSALFALTYAALRLLLVALYGEAAWRMPHVRDFAMRYIIGFTAGALIWLVSIAVPPPARYAVWAIALLIELGTPVWAYLTTSTMPVQRSHMPERFGLFTLIVLGGAIVVVGSGVAETGWVCPAVLTATLGFAIAVCVWWLYFARIDEEAFDRAAASGQWRPIAVSFVYGYGHLLIYAGITAASVGIEFAIADAAPTLAGGAPAALCGGLAAALVGITAVQIAAVPTLPGPIQIARFVAVVVLLTLGLTGSAMTPLLLVGLIAALCVALLWWESAVSKPVQPAMVKHARH